MRSNYSHYLLRIRPARNPLIIVVLLAAAGMQTAAQSPASAEKPQGGGDDAKSRAIATMAGLPLGFEPNHGQLPPAVKYAAKGSQYTLFLTPSEAVFALPEHLELPSSLKTVATQTAARQASKPCIWTAIAMRLIGGRRSADFSVSYQLPGKKNYFIGRDKTKWATDVPMYSQVQAHDVYPGIDLIYRGINRELEFTFLVNPGADARKIRLAFAGARQVRVDLPGNLVVSSPAGDLQIHQPVAYQEAPDGERQLVGARFAQYRDKGVRLVLGPYNRRRQLIIDPSVTYATYLGGTGQDEGLGIAIDDSGNTYVTGATASPNFPNTGGGYSYMGGLDVFVTAFNSSGQLLFSTLVGGTEDDVGTSIAVSSAGVFVTGYSQSNDFPASANFCGAGCTPFPFGALCGTQNAFVFMLNSAGVFFFNSSVFLGGSDTDAGLAITLDTAYGAGFSYIYVAGQTTSPDFASCFPLENESQINMGHGTGPSDGFVSKIAESFGQFWFSTFLGGSDQDFAAGIALDKPSITETNIYVTGGTLSPDFYTTPGAFQPTCGTDGNCNGGKDDAFVTVLCTYREAPCNANGLTPNYVYSTFLGGSGVDDAYSIVADTSGNAYITGRTASSDFKLQNPYQGGLRGQQNAFVSELNSAGNGLIFSTYLGGSGIDAGLGLVVDQGDNIYVTGRTNSPDFPLAFPTQSTIGGANDAFISAFNPSGSSLTFSTFLGGSGDEDALGGSIAVDSTQNVYVTGDTNSTNFPVQNPYQGTIGSTQDCTINGNHTLCPDAYVAKLNVQPPNFATLMVTINGGSAGVLGSVMSDPPGIDGCSDEPGLMGICTANFALGTPVTLTATPDEDQFGGWSGDVPPSCGMNFSCEIQIAGNMNVTASFNPVTQLYSLSVQGAGVVGSSPGTGTITSSPAGINCGTGGQVCMFNFAAGTQVTLTATPDSGSYFYGWTQNPACSGTSPCVIVMNSNQAVDYTFLLSNGAPPPLPDFTLSVSPPSLGIVPVGSQGVAGIAIATLNGFTDTVNLSCSVLPQSTSSPSCSVTPSSLGIPVNGAGSATLTVNTTGLTAVRSRHTVGAALGLGFPFLAVLYRAGVKARSFRGRRNWLKLLIFAILLGALLFALACGSSSGGGSRGGVAQAGNYTVVVNAQGSSTLITHSTNVTITVQ